MTDGQVLSEKYPGYYYLPNGKYKQTVLWRGKCTNRYFVERKCAACGKDILVYEVNANRSDLLSCGKECRKKLDTHPDGFTKPKRKSQNLGLLTRMSEHPYANKDGYVCTHRLVMEAAIGRYLTPTEQVHHIDMDKYNNDISNLMLCKNSPEHHKMHGTLNKIVAALMRDGIIYFNRETASYEYLFR